MFAYRRRQRWLLYGLLVAMPLFTLLTFHLGLSEVLLGDYLKGGLWWSLAAVFVLLSAKGLVWRKFIGVEIHVTPEALRLEFGRHTETYTWDRVASVKDWPWCQLLQVYDTERRVILPVDYLLTDFAAFKLALTQQLEREKSLGA